MGKVQDVYSVCHRDQPVYWSIGVEESEKRIREDNTSEADHDAR